MNKNCKVIEERLNTDLNNVTNCFSDNNLMNLKNRACPLGDRTKTSKIVVNETEIYEYLGVMMDKS